MSNFLLADVLPLFTERDVEACVRSLPDAFVVRIPRTSQFFVINPIEKFLPKMSGTRTIKAEEIKLLADYPVVGPVDGDELVSQSATYKMGYRPTTYSIALAGQTVGASSAADLTIGAVVPLEFYPSDEIPSAYNPLPAPVLNPAFTQISFNGLKNLRGTLMVTLRMSSALAAAPTPEGKFSVTLTAGLLPGNPTYLSRTFQGTLVSYNNVLDSYTFEMPFELPYQTSSTGVNFILNLSNRTSANLVVAPTGSTANLNLF